MQRTANYIISFPRSGQHLTARFLNFYCEQRKINFSYCEYYNHCRQVPCNENRIFQKNHDFGLNLSIDKNCKYLVLYRSNMIEQLESYFRYHNFERTVLPDLSTIAGKDKLINYDDKKKLFNFIKKEKNYYFNFLEKWVFNDLKNILKIDYDKLIENPYEFCKIIKFFYEDDNSKKIVEEFLKFEKIEKKHEINFNF